MLLGSFALMGQSKLDVGANNFIRSQNRVARTGVAAMSLGNPTVVDDSRAAVLITLEPGASADDLTEQGIEVGGVYGDVVVAYATAQQLTELDGMESVKQVQRARRKRLLNNTARSASNVDQVHSGTELPQGYTGKGVIVGVIDGGFDPNHIMFKDADGNMRVKKFWKYTLNSFTNKISVTTYTGSSLASFTTDSNADTHATHVSGIAAGSYNFGTTGTTYYGMAPESDILMASGDYLSDDQVLGAAKEMIAYAQTEGKPLVVNMSLGDNVGPHDGSDAFTTALNSLAENTVFCLAAGNEADLDIVVKKTLTADDKTVKTTIIPTSDLTAENPRYQAYCDVEVWASDNRQLSVKFALINKTTGAVAFSQEATTSLKYVSCGSMYETGDVSNTTFNSAYSNSYMGLVKGLSSANNRYCAQMTFNLINKSTTKTYLPAIIVEGQPGQTVWIYNDAYYSSFSTSSLSGFDKTTTDGTISNMACGKNTIAVGAYASRSSGWGSNGSIANFSSWGTLADGRELPHVCAPGLDLISAMSTPYYKSSNYSSYYEPVSYSVTVGGTKYTWTKMSGTSMATPVMTGVSALWLQANPDMSPAELSEIATSTAKKGFPDSVQWGAGKLDAYEGIKKALKLSSVENVLDREESILMVKHLGDNRFEVFMPGATTIEATLYSLNGAAVAQTVGSETVTVDGSRLTSGIYLLKAVSGKHVATEKVVIK